jgi:hypothetical protein
MPRPYVAPLGLVFDITSFSWGWRPQAKLCRRIRGLRFEGSIVIHVDSRNRALLK